jgi:hypothetical protein
MIVLVAAAMPVRIADSFPIVNSVSILDILIVIAAGTLFLDLAFRPPDIGYPQLFWLLCFPFFVSIASLVWSQDRPETLRASFSYGEGLIAYLFVVRELSYLPSARVITYVKRYAYLLIIPGVLLLLHVPGFAPDLPGVKHSSGDYISYYSRLSHPVLGRSNNLAAVLAFFVPLLVYWGHTRHDRGIRRAGYIALLAIFLTLSRGTLLAFVIAGLLYAPFASGSRRKARGGGVGRRVGLAVVLGVVAIATFDALNPATHEFFRGRLTLANVSGRSELLSMSLPKLENRPLLGYGSGVTPDHDPLLAEGVHNTFVQQALSFGLPLGLLVSLALLGIAGAFFARRGSTALAGVIGYTVLVQLVSFLFEASFEGTVLRVLFYLSVGLAAGLLRATEAESRSVAPGIP